MVWGETPTITATSPIVKKVASDMRWPQPSVWTGGCPGLRCAADVAVERGADPAAGAVQEHALVAAADVKDLADLLGGPALQVPEHEDGGLGGWQGVDGLPGQPERLGGEHPVLRALARRGLRQVVGRQLGEREHAAAPRGLGPGLVEQDP